MGYAPYRGPWDLTVTGGHDPTRTMYDAFADVYRAGAQLGIPARELDATPLWMVGAMLRPPKTLEDETLDVFAERLAAAEGRGPEPEARSRPLADVIQIAGRMRGPA